MEKLQMSIKNYFKIFIGKYQTSFWLGIGQKSPAFPLHIALILCRKMIIILAPHTLSLNTLLYTFFYA